MTVIREWRRGRRSHQKKYSEMACRWPNVCWACFAFDRPYEWSGVWVIHRAHIVNQPRLEDVRVVNLLCPLCHLAQDLATGQEVYPGDDRPKLELAEMMWIKKKIDPKNFDREILQACSIRKLPRIRKPKQWYIRRMEAAPLLPRPVDHL
jgi:hypothetical protein